MVRYAKQTDISRIAEIVIFGKRVAYRSIFQDDIGSFCRLQVLDIIEEYQRFPHLLNDVMVYDDGIVKGAIRLKDWGEEVELCDFYVEPFFMGQGVGREMISFFIKEARNRKKSRIFLWVIKDNLSARRFYEKNDFHVNGMEQLIEGTNVMDVCYEMRL